MHTVNVTYALIMLTAIGVCAALLRTSQKWLPLSAIEKFGIGVGAFCGAMIGAKLPFVISDWSGLVSGTAWLADGKTIMFGIVGGYLGVEIAKWALEIRTKTGDTFAIPVAVAVAIGRLACFHAGCCYGIPTTLPWGVKFPTAWQDASLARHPTQLYEAAFHTMMAIALLGMQRRDLFRYQRLKLYLISYLAYRFCSEWLRPEIRFFGGLTGYQWSALVLIAVFVWLWRRDGRTVKDERFLVQSLRAGD